jgi:predicted ATPase/class 3 adenylate cyclase
VQPSSALVTFLFTDIEGSSLLWEREPVRMATALARHDAITREAVAARRGAIVKMAGDGAHAAFDDPLDAIGAAIDLQHALASDAATRAIPLLVRCGIHVGADERRDDDFFGPSVNRAARIMAAAHGGQVLVSQAVAELARDRLPSGVGLRDLGTVRLRDLALPERIHQLLAPSLRVDFPALRSLDTTPNNLPLQLTSFVGRERELAEVKKLLERTRLLTLVGSGGIGKTRLSLQASGDLLDDYPDGVWFVELASLSDERLVPQAVASTVGLREETGRPLVDAIAAFVKDRRLLLVLDNCEHVSLACAGLASRLLGSSATLTILASSREPLRVAGETTYTVPPLSMPVGRSPVTLAALGQYEAARLFIERVLAVQPDFQLDQRRATAVADVCDRLDGIPLAIELAAVHARVLSVENIAERLIDRLRLLTRGSRSALPRQQTLRASIDWSYELLTPAERELFCRLSVFAGGWSLEAAEAVGADANAGSASADVLDLLSNLVEKSLVSRGADGARYFLLNTVREYAQERLKESAGERAARARHLAHFLSLAEDIAAEGRSRNARFEQLDVERENLFAAFESCAVLDEGAASGLRLAHALKHWLLSRGLLAIGYRLVVEAVDRAGAEEHNVARCRALFDAAELAFLTGKYEAAKQHTEASLALADKIGHAAGRADALRLLGFVCLAYGASDDARASFESALAISRQLGNQSQLAAALNGLGEFHRSVKDWPSALPLYREAIALDRQVGDRRRLAVHLCNLAAALIASEDQAHRGTALLEALDIAEDISSRQVGRVVLEYCACLAAVSGEWESAACLYGAAEKQSEDMGYHREPMDADFLPPLIARTRAALDATTFAAAEAQGRNRSYAQAVASAREWLQARC